MNPELRQRARVALRAGAAALGGWDSLSQYLDFGPHNGDWLRSLLDQDITGWRGSDWVKAIESVEQDLLPLNPDFRYACSAYRTAYADQLELHPGAATG